MPDIVLSTLNAKYIHAAFGLRYLMANLGELRPQARLMEFDINQRPLDIAEALLEQNPKIVGLGVYIWNVGPTTELVATLKRLRPEVKIILGGPEVSYETEQQRIVELADHVITGEGDLKFAEVCRELLDAAAIIAKADSNAPSPHPSPHQMGRGWPISGVRGSPEMKAGSEWRGTELPKIIPATLPEFAQLALPYELYDAQDLAHRVVYVEASRGCPFTCEFCLSSLDIPVRAVALPVFLGEMEKLLERGLKQFKFVDRTFNLNVNTSKAILEFFLERHRPGNFYHFEMIPDRLPEALREVIARYPPGTLQFEVGIQTFNPEVGRLISRKQDYAKLADSFHFLREQTGVHIHADLIVGLPGEDVASFAAGFDRLIALRPQEIQVGILKRLRGTPIVRHDAEWGMVYNPNPPYEILQTRLINFATLQKLRRFARYWDMIGNSGNFVETMPLIWAVGVLLGGPAKAGTTNTTNRSPFAEFLRLSEWLHGRTQRTDSIALSRLMELLFEFLTREQGVAEKLTAETLWRDYQRGGRSDKPAFLREFLVEAEPVQPRRKREIAPKRQARHVKAL